MNEEEMREFLPIFLDEAGEQIEAMERGFLKLEHESTPELLQELFRAAHTVKGSSAAMGFLPMKELVHAMEDVLDKLRRNELRVSTELIDAMFAGQDALKVMLEEIAASGQATLDTVKLTARLRAALTESSPAAPSVQATPAPAPGASRSTWRVAPTLEQQTSLEEARSEGYSAWALRITLAEDCIMKSVRALMALQALDAKGAVLSVYPGEEEIENEAFEREFEAIFVSKESEEAIRALLLGVSEIAGVEQARWTGGEAGADAPNWTLTETQRAAAQDALAAECALRYLKVTLSPDCLIKSARALMTLQALEKVGSILIVSPNEEALENEEFESAFEILLATQESLETVRETALQVSEVVAVQVADWRIPEAADAAFAPPAPAEPIALVETSPAPEEKSAAQPEEKKAAAPVAQAQTVRVDVARLDKLLNLVGELVIDRTRIAQLGTRFEQAYEYNELVESLNETANHIGRITDELQEEIMKARMLPIENVFNRFPRMMRDLAQKLGKEINFVVEGKETELDRSVIEVIGDPLIHMLRNSVDHGVETPDDRAAKGKPRAGTVWLRARHEENHIVIEIEDDGKGMDPDKLRASAVSKGLMTQEAATRLTDKEALGLIFASGFSTAAQITDVSGRGVGMDIVRSNLQKLGAIIDIDSRAGFGSRFTIKLPLTLAIIRGLLVKALGNVYALPLSSVVETLKIAPNMVHEVNQREVILQRGKTLPIVRLNRIFRLNPAPIAAVRTWKERDQSNLRMEKQSADNENALPDEIGTHAVTQRSGSPAVADSLYVVVVGIAEKQVGLIVDSLIGEQEVVIKTLGKFIGDVRGISGATILGDGRVALIVDINGVFHLATEEKVKAYAA